MLLLPAEYQPSVFAIDLQRLQARGIRGLILDLDNTLVPWDESEPTPAVVQWLAQARKSGLAACIVSNNGLSRVESFARQLGVPFIHKAVKPRRRPFREAMALLGTAPAETAVVGDQIFTDVLGGNRIGCYTILVVPLSEREFIGTRLVRQLERLVLRHLQGRGLLRREGWSGP